MRYTSLKAHLKPYTIHANRKTTINHAFAASIAPYDKFCEKVVKKAIRALGQDPEKDLQCVYCDDTAETWDHVHATVSKSKFSGAGHRIGNLLPCCKPCNSKKGNKKWDAFIRAREANNIPRKKRIRRIENYLRKHYRPDKIPGRISEYKQLQEIQATILELMQEADALAEKVRAKMEKAAAATKKKTSLR